MKTIHPFAALLLVACASNPPANDSAREPTAEPASTEMGAPAGSDGPPASTASAAASTPAPSGPQTKCAQSGGKCIPLVATTVCLKSQNDPEWGCSESQYCCMN